MSKKKVCPSLLEQNLAPADGAYDLAAQPGNPATSPQNAGASSELSPGQLGGSNLDDVVEKFTKLAYGKKLVGFWPDIPEEVYNHPKFPGVRSSDVKIVAKKSYKHMLLNREEKKTKAEAEHYRIGKAFHALMEGAEDRDLKDKYKLFEFELANLKFMRANTLQVPELEEAIKSPTAMRELTVFAICPQTGLLLRCRPDIYDPSLKLVLDFKTSQDASPDGFQRSAKQMGYKMSAAFYLYIMQILLRDPVQEFRIGAVEKEFPNFAVVKSYYHDTMEYEQARLFRTLERIKEAVDGGFDGYDPRERDLLY